MPTAARQALSSQLGLLPSTSPARYDPATSSKPNRERPDGARFDGLILPLDRDQVVAAGTEGGNGEVTIGFRPEDTDLVGENDGGLPVTVELVEELGSDAFVYGSTPDGGDRIVVRTSGRNTPRMADTVYVRPHVGAHHAFHARTGVRL